MARTKTRKRNLGGGILALSLALGGVLMIVFALMEYGFGMRMFAEEGDPAITETTISDTQDHNDDVKLREPAAPGQGVVRVNPSLGGPFTMPTDSPAESQAKP